MNEVKIGETKLCELQGMADSGCSITPLFEISRRRSRLNRALFYKFYNEVIIWRKTRKVHRR